MGSSISRRTTQHLEEILSHEEDHARCSWGYRERGAGRSLLPTTASTTVGFLGREYDPALDRSPSPEYGDRRGSYGSTPCRFPPFSSPGVGGLVGVGGFFNGSGPLAAAQPGGGFGRLPRQPQQVLGQPMIPQPNFPPSTPSQTIPRTILLPEERISSPPCGIGGASPQGGPAPAPLEGPPGPPLAVLEHFRAVQAWQENNETLKLFQKRYDELQRRQAALQEQQQGMEARQVGGVLAESGRRSFG